MNIQCVVVMAAVAFGACSKREDGGKATDRQGKATTAKPQCGDQPCLAVPTGIKGLSFGMEPDEVRTALNPSEWTPPESPHRVAPTNDGHWPDRDHSRPVPGVSTSVVTTLGGAEAECRLDFSEAKKLLGITCDVERRNEELRELFDSIVRSLTDRHGPATEVKSRRVESFTATNRTETYRFDWRSADALLRVRLGTREPLSPAKSFRLANMTPNHELQLKRAVAAANQSVDDAAAQAAAEEQARREAERRAVEEGKKQLVDDLSGAAEKP